MKNIVFKVVIAISIVSCCISQGKSQVSFLGNNSANPAHFSGWAAGVTFPFQVRHDGNQSILFSTNGNQNMEITSYRNVGVGTTGTVRSKFLALLTPANVSLGQGPFESVALAGVNTFSMVAMNAQNIGVRGISTGISPVGGLMNNNIGGFFQSYNAERNIGVDAMTIPVTGAENPGLIGWAVRAVASGHTASNAGIVARAVHGANPGPNAELVGISAGIDALVGNPNEWAGFFQGNVNTLGSYFSFGVLVASDEQFKTNIEPIEDALSLVNSIPLRKFQYNQEGFTRYNMPGGTHYGVIAQELFEVAPELVKESRIISIRDTAGQVIEEPRDFLAVNYLEMVPLLAAAMQEQQSIIEAQSEALAGVMDQLNALQDQINNCCGGDSGYKNMGSGDAEEEQKQKTSPNGNMLNQNTPNPFRSQTTISYTLEQGGKVLLNIFDKTGKPIATLVEAEQPADTYRYDWDASGLPAGLYHYALYVDGELLVKKAIKLAD